MIYFIITLIFYFLYVALKTRKQLHILQQNTYNRENRYIHWIFKNLKSLFLTIDILVFLPLLIAVISNNDMFYVLIAITYLFLFVELLNQKKKEQIKKPLEYTSRIKRLIFTYSLVTILIFYFILSSFDKLNVEIYYLICALYAYLTCFVVYIVNLINYPAEKFVYYYYFNKSQKKLKSMPSLKIVGITGSYGKTSSKNILESILNEKYRVLASPKSYNTRFGLMKTINENLTKFDEVFIAEMGAIRKGDIKAICKIVRPQYGILTRIGVAHLETFKSIENITKTKFQLIDALPDNGIGILNKDDEYQREYYRNGKKKIKWIGITSEDVDVKAHNIKCTYEGTTFEITFKGDKKSYSFKTLLLGDANVYNILSCVALAKELGVSIHQMQSGVNKLKPIEHRLQLKQVGDITIIDDAFNSNPIGSKMALDVLAMMPGKKIIITPGMIELGEKEHELNKEFGKHMAKCTDVAILIGENQTKPIYEGLLDENFNKDNIYILNDVKKALSLIHTLKDRSTYVLLENDLPDLFNE